MVWLSPLRCVPFLLRGENTHWNWAVSPNSVCGLGALLALTESEPTVLRLAPARVSPSSFTTPLVLERKKKRPFATLQIWGKLVRILLVLFSSLWLCPPTVAFQPGLGLGDEPFGVPPTSLSSPMVVRRHPVPIASLGCSRWPFFSCLLILYYFFLYSSVNY